MSPTELRVVIEAARAQCLDEEARPHVVLKLWRKTEPRGQRVRVMPGVMGELLITEPAAGGVLVVVRAWCDDLERALNRLDKK